MYMKSQWIGVGFAMFIYLAIAFIGLLLFGNTILPSVLENFGEITTPSGEPFFESGVIEIAFIIVLMCHIPFVFFAGKEAVCIMVDEIDRKSISSVLQQKVNELTDKTTPANPETVDLDAILAEFEGNQNNKQLLVSVLSTH